VGAAAVARPAVPVGAWDRAGGRLRPSAEAAPPHRRWRRAPTCRVVPEQGIRLRLIPGLRGVAGCLQSVGQAVLVLLEREPHGAKVRAKWPPQSPAAAGCTGRHAGRVLAPAGSRSLDVAAVSELFLLPPDSLLAPGSPGRTLGLTDPPDAVVSPLPCCSLPLAWCSQQGRGLSQTWHSVLLYYPWPWSTAAPGTGWHQLSLPVSERNPGNPRFSRRACPSTGGSTTCSSTYPSRCQPPAFSLPWALLLASWLFISWIMFVLPRISHPQESPRPWLPSVAGWTVTALWPVQGHWGRFHGCWRQHPCAEQGLGPL